MQAHSMGTFCTHTFGPKALADHSILMGVLNSTHLRRAGARQEVPALSAANYVAAPVVRRVQLRSSETTPPSEDGALYAHSQREADATMQNNIKVAAGAQCTAVDTYV